MAVQMVLNLLLLLAALEAVHVHGFQDFSLALSGTNYSNNSVIAIEDIGEGIGTRPTDSGNGALYCHSESTTCCQGIDNPPDGVGRGDWYFPDGTVVLSPAAAVNGEHFYRARLTGLIGLNRRPGGTMPTGVYRCEVPDENQILQTRYIGIYPGSIIITPSTSQLVVPTSTNRALSMLVSSNSLASTNILIPATLSIVPLVTSTSSPTDPTTARPSTIEDTTSSVIVPGPSDLTRTIAIIIGLVVIIAIIATSIVIVIIVVVCLRSRQGKYNIDKRPPLPLPRNILQVPQQPVHGHSTSDNDPQHDYEELNAVNMPADYLVVQPTRKLPESNFDITACPAYVSATDTVTDDNSYVIPDINT